MQRRMSVIFAADMVGYSRLMEADEPGTLERQNMYRDEILNPALDKFNGTVFKEIGDGLLVEFHSAIEAVECAVNIQRGILKREADAPFERKIQYRIGINLGDVVSKGEDLFGDGVNIAARLEQLAEPSGICISGTAYDHLRTQIDVTYEPLGEVHLKNIERPIRAYRVLLDNDPKKTDPKKRLGVPRIGNGKKMATVAAILLATTGAGALWWLQQSNSDPVISEDTPNIEYESSPEKRASIAVLPFQNNSEQEDQLFFADGITDDITINLTKVPGLSVIARDSSFIFRDELNDIKQVADALNVGYVLRGSVRRRDQDVRVTASLIEGKTGKLIWADGYDTKLGNVFTLQGEIANQIASELSKKFETIGQAVSVHRDTNDLVAYDLFLKGRELFYRFSRENLFKAREYFERAIKRDEEFASAIAMLAWTYAFEYNNGWARDNETSLKKAFELAAEATALNNNLPVAHFIKALVHRERGEHIQAMAEAQRAIEIDPNYANAYIMLATLLYYGGSPEEGLALIEKAEKLHPYHPSNYPFHKGQALFILKRYDEAVEVLREGLKQNPTSQRLRVWLAASLVQVGQTAEAEWEVDQILLDDPEFDQANLHHVFPFTDSEAEQRFYGALEKAGFQYRF